MPIRPRWALSRGKTVRAGRCSIRHRAPRHRRFVRQAEPGDAGEEPGDVRGRSRAPRSPPFLMVRDAGDGRGRTSASNSRSRCGSGSRCCSPTSPKPWRKAAAKPRPTACARPRPTPGQEARGSNGKIEMVPGSRRCAKATSCLCEPNDMIPGDGDVIEGIASVDESVITGESAPVIRESGGDRSAVTGGTKVLSDYIKVQITSNPGETFLDRMIALVEGAQRQKTPNEIALNIMIAGLTLIFLLAVVTLRRSRSTASTQAKAGTVPSVTVLVSLLVCLIPTTIGGLLSAIGIAGMDRVMQHNVLAMSGKAVEAAGDVNTLLLDKTGTITLGNRQAVEFIPADGVYEAELADAAQLSSLADETPEGRSIVVLAKEKYGLRGREIAEHEAEFIPFTAQTRMSGVNYRGPRDPQRRHRIDPPASSSNAAATFPQRIARTSPTASRAPAARLWSCRDGKRVLGVIHLKDIVKGGMSERFAQMRAMGIRTVMITGDNPLTAAAIATEAGVDDFLAQATPKDKLESDQARTGRRTPGRHDRRRHQRCAGAGAGRRRRGHEHRHHGRQRSRQHGGSRQQSDQAD